MLNKQHSISMTFKPQPLKTCLRYPGGKSKALKTLASFLPSDIQEFRDPFLGGGSVPLMVSQNNPNLPVWVNDKYYILYNFWTQLQADGEKLTETLLNSIPEDITDLEGYEKLFYKSKDLLNDTTNNKFDLAVAFYLANKSSYSGLTERGTFSRTTIGNNLSSVGIKKLPSYSSVIKNWKITNEDYTLPLLSKGDEVFVFLDPPYDIKSFLYGGRKGDLHQSFSHEEFANSVDKCKHRFGITYNVNDWIMDRFKSYHETTWKLRYSMNHREDNIKTEVYIHNYDLPT